MPVPALTLAAIRQPAFLWGVDGRVAEANDRAEALAGGPLAGMAAADVIARFSVRRRDGSPVMPRALPAALALAGEEAVDVPFTITVAGGWTLHVLATASPLRDGDAVAGALVVWQDVTAEAEAARALAARNDALQAREEEIAVQNEELQVMGEELQVQNEELRCQGDELREQSEALRGSLERLGFAQLAARTGFWDWDVPTTRLAWSPEFYDLFGLDPGAPPSFETWLAVLHPDDRDRAMAAINRSMEERTPLENECRAVLPGGRVRWIGAYGDTAYDAAGRPRRMAGICVDITARREAEAALRESEGRFRSVLDHSLDALYRLNLQTGRYEYASPAFERVVGRTAEEMASESPDEAMSWIHPDDLPVVAAGLARLEEAGSAEVDYRVRDRGGRYRWISNHLSLVRDGAGRPLYRDGVVRDVTRQRETEEAIRRRAEELEAVMDLVPAAIWVGHDAGCTSITGNRLANDFYEAEPGENVSAGRLPPESPSPRAFLAPDGRELAPEELPMQAASAANAPVREAEFAVLLPSGRRRRC